MSKASKRLGWAFFWLASGVSAVVAIIAAPGIPPWSLYLLLGFAGVSFTASAYLFGLLRAACDWYISPNSHNSSGYLGGILFLCSKVLNGPSLPIHIRNYEIKDSAIGKDVEVNIHFYNSGNSNVNVVWAYAVAVGPLPADRVAVERNESEVYDKAVNSADNSEANVQALEQTVPPKAEMHGILHGHPLRSEQMARLQDGTSSVYFAGQIRYQLDSASHWTDFCGHSDTNKNTIPNCRKHNGQY